MDNLYANEVRILRPSEVTKLINAIPKEDNKAKFEALFYTGARYSEIKLLFENRRWFNGISINMPNTKYLAKKKYKTRSIRLNPQGQRAVNQYLFRCKRGLPHYTNWYKNLKRWCKLAGIDADGIGIKTSRKTWECFLVTHFEERSLHIFLSQGHTEATALGSYLNLGFTEEDKVQMRPFVEGWL
jgi:hypothetical protein